MKLLSISTVEVGETEYDVELYDISCNVLVYKRRENGPLANPRTTIYRQRIKFGSQRFMQALRALVVRAEPGSLTREHLTQCDSNLVRKAMKLEAR